MPDPVSAISTRSRGSGAVRVQVGLAGFGAVLGSSWQVSGQG